MIGTLLLFTLGSGLGSGQDLGEAARLERQRRATLTKHAPTLTDEDLKRPRILPAPAQAKGTAPAIENRRVETPASAQGPAITTCNPPECSLGEYARAFRLRKLQRQRERAERLAARPANNEPKTSAAKPPVIKVPSPKSLSVSVKRSHDVAGRATERFASGGARIHPAGEGKQPSSVRSIAKAKPNEQLHDAKSVIVRPGDSLWRISRRYLGDGRLWILLWKANAAIRKPDLLYPGQLLMLPSRSEIQLARVAGGPHLRK